jgi:predicted nucleic acid-binding protein
MDELARVIARQKFAGILQRTSRTPERILLELRTFAELVAAPPLPQPVCRDPDDDAVLACALAAQVDLIVSGDADLLVLEQFEGIRIVTPAQAVKMISSLKKSHSLPGERRWVAFYLLKKREGGITLLS